MKSATWFRLAGGALGSLVAISVGLAMTGLIFFMLGMQQLSNLRSSPAIVNRQEVKTVQMKMERPKPKEQRRSRPQPQNRQQNPLPSASQSLDWLGSLGSAGGRGAAWSLAGNMDALSSGTDAHDVDPRLLFSVPPKYPDKARKYGVTGRVRTLLTIGVDGSVTDIQFLEIPDGDYGFREAVTEAVQKWRFEPAKAGGVPVPAKMEQPFQF